MRTRRSVAYLFARVLACLPALVFGACVGLGPRPVVEDSIELTLESDGGATRLHGDRLTLFAAPDAVARPAKLTLTQLPTSSLPDSLDLGFRLRVHAALSTPIKIFAAAGRDRNHRPRLWRQTAPDLWTEVPSHFDPGARTLQATLPQVFGTATYAFTRAPAPALAARPLF